MTQHVAQPVDNIAADAGRFPFLTGIEANTNQQQ